MKPDSAIADMIFGDVESGILKYILDPSTWQILTAITLIVTLIYIINYTRATKRLANETSVSAEIQKREFLYKQRPVISIFNFKPEEFYFIPVFYNFSNVHAKLRVKATIKFGEKTLKLPEGHLYNGEKIWQLQAGGNEAPRLFGNLDFRRILEVNEMIIAPELSEKGKLYEDTIDYTGDFYKRNMEYASITIECWAVNINRSDDELNNKENKNPVVQWYWKKKSRRWIPEVCPLLPLDSTLDRDS
jgi:hypothetical protein